jgi:hypothetical protein
VHSERIIRRFTFFGTYFSRLLLAAGWLFVAACSRQQAPPDAALAAINPSSEIQSTHTASPTHNYTHTAAPTLTSTSTARPSPTLTATPSAVPSGTPTLTPNVPIAIALMRAFCRYGPGKAYLYSHELKEGDLTLIDGRNASGAWLWVQPGNLDRHCWVSTSVVEIHGDLSGVNVVQTRLPHSTLYGPPDEIEAERDGDVVIITWEPVWMTQDDDRGYLIEATVCQNGSRVWISAHTDNNSYELTDERGCSGESGGKLYTVEKHGYTDPVTIPWP